MSDNPKLVAELRQQLGSSATRKIRAAGRIPGNLYGLDKDPVPFSVKEEALRPVVYGGAKVVELECDGNSEVALVRDVQWDTFSKFVEHFDLQRVDPTKKMQVEIALELRGTAEGVVDGGVLDQPHRTVNIECLAHQIPDHIYVRIAHLKIGDAIHLSDLPVPPGATFLDDPQTLIVRVNAPLSEEELAEEIEGGAPAEPELVGESENEDNESE